VPKKPESDEKTTMKAVVADAFFGSKPSHTSTQGGYDKVSAAYAWKAPQ